MIKVWRAVAVLMTAWLLAGSAGAQPTPPSSGRWRELRTMAVIPFHGDSLRVRAAFLHRPETEGGDTFASYWVEAGDGRIWAADSIVPAGELWDGVGCDLACRVAPRKGDVLVTMESGCWPAYPNVVPTYQYVVLRLGRVVRSEWTQASWDPARGDSADVFVEESCAAYAIPLQVLSEGERVEFAVRRPHGIAASQEFRVGAGIATCIRMNEQEVTRTIPVYPQVNSSTPRPMTVRVAPSAFSLEVIAAYVRASGTLDKDFSSQVRLLEIELDGRKLLIAPETLHELGLHEP